jgi:hypothetical protein
MLDLANVVISAPALAIGEAARAPEVLSSTICLLGYVLAYGVAGGVLGAALSPLNRSRRARIVLICAMGLVFMAIQAIFVHYWPAPMDLMR